MKKENIEMTNKNPTDLVARALTFAARAHEESGILRKFTGEPYIVHPIAVFEMVRDRVSWATPEMLAAALLHDVVEDTTVGILDLEEEFGVPVANIVDELTFLRIWPDRAKNLKADVTLTRLSSRAAQTIRCADIMDNSQDIAQHDPDYAQMYLREKRAILATMKRADRTLHADAVRLVEWEISKLDGSVN